MNHIKDIAYDLTLALFSVCIIILSVFLFIFCRKKPVESVETLDHHHHHHHNHDHDHDQAKAYSLTDIDAATDRFNQNRIIGKGRLGTVYAANLSKGDLVAVKRIHPFLVLTNGGLGFSSNLKKLSLARHPNIAPIQGFSQAPGERIIVMELVGMVSLDYYLHEITDGASLLDWTKRFRVASGVAKGLEYLHEEMSPSVIHGCLKPSNVLLDVKFNVKICDYGLSFLASKEEKRGVLGYVDDEFWVDGVSKECDVYGLGVVLLEILSGRKCEEGLLVKWATPLIKEMRYDEVLDSRVLMTCDISYIVRLGKVALACVGNSRKNRPSISQVVTILSNLVS